MSVDEVRMVFATMLGFRLNVYSRDEITFLQDQTLAPVRWDSLQVAPDPMDTTDHDIVKRLEADFPGDISTTGTFDFKISL